MKKYILLLFTTLSFAQASNQMVTFTQAQSLGFSLKSGQSHVTSNQCMTKADVLVKYNVTISGYADNQLVPRSAWVSSESSYSHLVSHSTFSDRFSACYQNIPTFQILYSYSSTIINGTVLYSNASLAEVTRFYGNSAYYLIKTSNGDISAKITAQGVVNLPEFCTP